MNNLINRPKILIADAQYLTNKALEIILGEKYNVLGIVENRSELAKYLKSEQDFLIILDFALFDFDSLSEIKELKSKVSNILILSNSVNQSEFAELSDAGIENILLKSTNSDELFRAIESTLKGKRYYSEEILELILEKSYKKDIANEPCHLTTAEIEIVKLIAEGQTTKQIATQKFISFHTVMTHRKNIFRKLGVKSISELIMYAIKAGWIENIEYYI